MSRVLIGNLPPGTTIRNIDDFCSPFGRLLYVDVKTQGNATLACVEYEAARNANNLIRARNGYNFNGYTVQMKVMTENSGSGGLFEVRDDSRRRNAPSGGSASSYRSQNNYYDNFNSSSGGSMGDNNLDFTEACRIVYDRFVSEGYNPKIAREKALEFVSNMRGGNNQGFDNSNSDYFNHPQGRAGMQSNFGQGGMSSNNFDNYANGNQNWGGNSGGGGGNWGGNQNWGGSQNSFPQNSNWGSFNGPNNQQNPSSWGGPRYGYNNSGWNNGGNNYHPNSGRMGGRQPQQQPINAVDHDTYLKSVAIRKKIEAKITKGISTPRDLRNLQFHTQIINDYERSVRYQKKALVNNSNESDEFQKLQRYKSALGIVHKFKKMNKSLLSPEDLKSYNRNKVIVDEYESYVASKNKGRAPGGGGKNGAAVAAFERRKKQLINEAKKTYGTDFRLSGAAKKKMRFLVAEDFEMDDARLLALHSSVVVKEIIDMKKAAGIKGKPVDNSKALVAVKGAGKAKPAGDAKPAAPVDPAAGKLGEMSKKERAALRSANRLISKYEARNAEIESLTQKDIILLRIALKRLKTFNEKFETPVPQTKYEELLSEKYDKKEDDDATKKEGEAAEQNNEGGDAEANGDDDGKDAEAGEGEEDQTAADE
ncbi:uncharacterized protein LOC142220211 [Haematobia irritans]|uniref:uncharacterized protein LOC142220211 n=1 Tax=Haematobia irritans TaxID=7368 RepID=UPI003F500E58